MKHVNILVFPCGSEVGLELNRALKDISFITLIGASSVEDHGKYVFENYVEGLPFVTASDFIDKFNQLLVQEKIDYIYPAMDQVMDILSKNRERLHAELIAPCHDAVSVCRNKARTYRRLKDTYFVPKVYSDPEDVTEYPVIIKPEEGYGAKGFKILHDQEELIYEFKQAAVPMVICEYLEGEEYTIDCFTNRHGQLQYVSCRSRGRVRNGISVKSEIQPYDPEIASIAMQISERIQMRGAWFFQLKRNCAGQYRLLEVATRIAGTMCINRALGVNLPLLSVFDQMGYDVSIPDHVMEAKVDRALYNAFCLPKRYSEVYMDFDDTIIVHSRVNTTLMRYIYQCVNNQIPLKLITKHETNVVDDLKKYHISVDLFEEIICIDRDQKKCNYVSPKPDALFIDDSFAERKQMHDAWGIDTLGVDSVECLIDYRQ